MRLINTEATIQTSNFILEPILPSHASKLYKYLLSKNLYTFIPTNPPVSISDLEHKYIRWAKRKSDDESEIWLNYAIYDVSINEYIGTLQATLFISGENYIAYEVFPKNWRKGLAKVACSAFIKYLFEYYNLDIIKAHIDTRNIASYKLVESLGFIRTGEIKNADEFKGSISDEYIYTISSARFDELYYTNKIIVSS